MAAVVEPRPTTAAILGQSSCAAVPYNPQMSSGAWELIFMLLILKIPMVYLGFVVWYAIRAEPEAGVEPDEHSVWHPWRRPTAPRRPAWETRCRPRRPRAPRYSRPVISGREETRRPAETVAGLMAAGALFIGALELVYRQLRLAPAALILALVATVMSRDQQRLIALAIAVIGICFIVGATLQILTHHPLY